jgi:hypothetical protein
MNASYWLSIHCKNLERFELILNLVNPLENRLNHLLYSILYERRLYDMLVPKATRSYLGLVVVIRLVSRVLTNKLEIIIL